MTIRVRPLLFSFVLAAGLLAGARADAQTAVSLNVQVGDFHLAVSNYYRVPAHDVVVLHDRRVRDEELPVVYFIAQHAHVAPATVVDLRLRGLSWWSISTRFHLGPEVYYVPVTTTPGLPYERAYGYYKRPRSQWHSIVLADADIIHLVNVRFLSEYYHVPPERVIAAREHETDFVAVQRQVSGHDASTGGVAIERKDAPASRGGDPDPNGRGRGRGGR